MSKKRATNKDKEALSYSPAGKVACALFDFLGVYWVSGLYSRDSKPQFFLGIKTCAESAL